MILKLGVARGSAKFSSSSMGKAARLIVMLKETITKSVRVSNSSPNYKQQTGYHFRFVTNIHVFDLLLLFYVILF